LVGASEAPANDLAFQGAALVEGEMLEVLGQSRLALLVHKQHETNPHSLSRLSLIPSSIYGSRSRSRSDLSRREWEWEWEWELEWHLYPTNYSIRFGPFPSSPVACGLWRASGTRSCGSTLTKGPHPKPTLHYINK
jgi:hypothetical protein